MRYNDKLKDLFQTGSLTNIKLALELIEGREIDFDYVSEKCLEEWLPWSNMKRSIFSVKQNYIEFFPIDFDLRGRCWIGITYQYSKNNFKVNFQCYNEMTRVFDIYEIDNITQEDLLDKSKVVMKKYLQWIKNH